MGRLRRLARQSCPWAAGTGAHLYKGGRRVLTCCTRGLQSRGQLRKATDTGRAASGSQPGVSDPGPCSRGSGAQRPDPSDEPASRSPGGTASLLAPHAGNPRTRAGGTRGPRGPGGGEKWLGAPRMVGSFHGLQRPRGPTTAPHFSQLPPEWLKGPSAQDPQLRVAVVQ